MAEEKSTSSKLFWWTMGIVATILSAEIIAALNLSGVRPASASIRPAVTAPETIIATTPSATTPDYSGMYYGSALNGGAIGNVRLQVNEVNPAGGATTAQVNWSGLLSGAGPLRGTFVANKATFEGEIDSRAGPWDVGLDCTFSTGANVTCDYRLQAVAPNDYAPQRGSLTADKS